MSHESVPNKKSWREQALIFLNENHKCMTLDEVMTIRKFINGKIENGLLVETIDTNTNIDCKDLYGINSHIDSFLDNVGEGGPSACYDHEV